MNISIDAVNAIVNRHPPELIYVKDKYSKYIDANQAFVSHYNLSHVKQLRQRTDYDLPAACFAEQYIQHDREAIETGELQVIEPAITPEGQYVLMLAYKYSFSDPQTQQDGVIGISRILNNTAILALMPILDSPNFNHLKISDVLFNTRVNQHARAPLTERELDVFYYTLHGLCQKQVANKLNLSVRTVEDYVIRIKDKLNCGNKQQLFEFAMSHNLLNIIPQRLLNIVI